MTKHHEERTQKSQQKSAAFLKLEKFYNIRNSEGGQPAPPSTPLASGRNKKLYALARTRNARTQARNLSN